VATPTLRDRLTGLVLVVAAIAAVWFAVQGGEYGTVDLLRQSSRQAELRREIDSLKRIVDSLAAYKQQVLTDPRVQERIAREEFGMIRRKELLYRIASPDSQP